MTPSDLGAHNPEDTPVVGESSRLRMGERPHCRRKGCRASFGHHKAQAAADRRTRGKYRDQIKKAVTKAEQQDRASTKPQPPQEVGSDRAGKPAA
jgi:hypothetical protein